MSKTVALVNIHDLKHLLIEGCDMIPGLSSMNRFYEHGIGQIISDVFKEEDTPIEDKVRFTFRMSNAVVGTPKNSDGTPIFPYQARARRINYDASVTCDVYILLTDVASGKTREEKFSMELCRVPIMIRSSRCNTSVIAADREELIRINEDPDDQGGYVIAGGIEYSLQISIDADVNQIKTIADNTLESKTAVYQDIISRPGNGFENSGRTIVEISKTGLIYFTLHRKPFHFPIPFFAVLGLFGMTNQRDITLLITEGRTEGDIYDMLVKQALVVDSYAWKQPAITTQDSYADAIIDNNLKPIAEWANRHDKTGGNLELSAEKRVMTKQKMFKLFDSFVLPHIGDSGSRDLKVRQICGYIRTAIRYYLGHVKSDSRDDNLRKRFTAAGEAFSKGFKTAIGKDLINPLKNELKKVVRKGTPFAEINLRNIVPSPSQQITAMFKKFFTAKPSSGQIKTNSGDQVTKRMATNHTIPSSAMRPFKDPRTMQVMSKTAQATSGGARAMEVRAVHTTSMHGICLTNSPEGKSAGINLQLAIATQITPPGCVYTTMQTLKAMPDLVHPENLAVTELSSYVEVFSNGVLAGYVNDYMTFLQKLRNSRRKGGFTKATSFHYSAKDGSIQIYTDYGRLMFPVFIVESKLAVVKGKVKFTQELLVDRLNPKQVLKMSISELEEAGVLEYITLQEQTNAVFAKDFATVRENRNNIYEHFTHVVIPGTALGLPAHCTPFPQMNPVSRNTFASNQGNQSVGWPVQNWHHRMYKGVYITTGLQAPLVRTLGEMMLPPAGFNALVAIMPFKGGNQEDAIIISEALAVYLGTHAADPRAHIIPSLGTIGTATAANCSIAKDGNPSKLVDGIIREGVIVNDGDVLVGSYEPIMDEDGNNTGYAGRGNRDTSLIYHGKPAFVQSVRQTVSSGTNETIVTVNLLVPKILQLGDKFSSRHGQKGVCSLIVPKAMLPVTKSGISPSLLINPHAIPSRMTIGQLLEQLLGLYGASTMEFQDGAAYRNISARYLLERMDEIKTAAQKRGFTFLNDMGKSGQFKLYNGETMEPMEQPVEMGFVGYRRLDKFAEGVLHTADSARRDAVTHQPVRGRSRDGAPREGEMEVQAKVAVGAAGCTLDSIRLSDEVSFYICDKCHRRFHVANPAPDRVMFICNTVGCPGGNPLEMESRHAASRVHEVFRASGTGLQFH